MEIGPFPDPTPKAISKDFKVRRGALLKALTSGFDYMYAQCDPEEDPLYLFADSDGNWEVRKPLAEVPPEIPQPALGINLVREGMDLFDWKLMVAFYSDSWLLTLAMYYAMNYKFGKDDRRELILKLNSLPTLTEMIKRERKQTRNETITSTTPNSSKRQKSNKQNRQPESQVRGIRISEEEQQDDEKDAVCGACGVRTTFFDNWICCDGCDIWFHVDCVDMTSTKANSIKRYNCSICTENRKIQKEERSSRSL